MLAAVAVLAIIGAAVWLARDRIEWPEDRADRLIISNQGGAVFECLFLFDGWSTRGPEPFGPGVGRTYDISVAGDRAVSLLGDHDMSERLEAIHCVDPGDPAAVHVRITPRDVGTARVRDGIVRFVCAVGEGRLGCSASD